MSVLLLLYGIETPDADAPPTPTPTPDVVRTGAGAPFRRRIPQVVTFDNKIEKDDEELVALGIL